MTRLLPNGMGAPQADSLAVLGPVYMTGQVWYVNSATGVDAVSPRGLTEEYPLATLAQACTNAASGDTIVLMRDHTETISAQIAVSAKIFNIIGSGRSAGRPTVKLTNNVLSAPMLLFDAVHCRIRNIWFTAPAGAASQPAIRIDAFMMMDECHFELNGNNDAGAYGLLTIDSASADIKGTTFASTATVKTDRPAPGFVATSNQRLLRMRNVVFDGGPFGWDAYAADIGPVSPFGMTLESVSLLRGADMLIDSSATGLVQLAMVTGGSRLNW